MRQNPSFTASLVLLLLGMACWSCETKPTILDQLNEPPRIIELKAGSNRVFIRDYTRLTCLAMDPDGDSLSYQWESATNSVEGSGASVRWFAPGTSAQFPVTCTVRDEFGGMDRQETTLYVFYYDSVRFETLDRQIHNTLRVVQRGHRVFRTWGEWAAFWSVHTYGTRVPPAIDFDHRTVIGALWGLTSGCANYYPHFIPAVGTSGDTLYVQIDFPPRPAFFGGCDAEITPMHLISIKKTELPVKFLAR